MCGRQSWLCISLRNTLSYQSFLINKNGKNSGDIDEHLPQNHTIAANVYSSIEYQSYNDNQMHKYYAIIY